MISGKDVRIENGYIIINGEKYPIVQDVSEIEGEVEELTELVSGKPDKFVSSSNGATQDINIGTTVGNKMFLLSCGYSTQYGDHYVFGLILINDSGRIKYVSLVADSGITVAATFANGIVSLTFSEAPYSNAVLIRLS